MYGNPKSTSDSDKCSNYHALCQQWAVCLNKRWDVAPCSPNISSRVAPQQRVLITVAAMT